MLLTCPKPGRNKYVISGAAALFTHPFLERLHAIPTDDDELRECRTYLYGQSVVEIGIYGVYLLSTYDHMTIHTEEISWVQLMLKGLQRMIDDIGGIVLCAEISFSIFTVEVSHFICTKGMILQANSDQKFFLVDKLLFALIYIA